MYAVVDIETTGLKASQCKIIEIAIVLHDGKAIQDTFSSLINPETFIPAHISRVTGITNDMVAHAPKFYEIAKIIVEMTENVVFVAHNARFDYSFVQQEFSRLGFRYIRKRLCTVRYGRKVIPGLKSYSLKNLTNFFKIPLENAHRALDDTLATTKLFEILLSRDTDDALNNLVNMGLTSKNLPDELSMEQLHELPEECGVYYFYNDKKEVIYVGKSINIKKRVMQHFAGKQRKTEKMCSFIRDISWELTGSELVSLLFESDEIKRLSPRFNSAQKNRSFPYAIQAYTNAAGYNCLAIADYKGQAVLSRHSSAIEARSALESIARKFELCKVYLNIESRKGACFGYQIKSCKGACIQEESAEDYNKRMARASEHLQIDFDKNIIIMDKGRSHDERAVVLVEDGHYKGFGYVQEYVNHSIDDLKTAIKHYQNNRDVARIIKHYIRVNSKALKVIRF